MHTHLNLSHHVAASLYRQMFRLTMAAAIALGMAITIQAGQAIAHEYKAGGLKIDHPWTRTTPPGVKVGAGYLTIENTGATGDKLIGGTFETASKVELHTTEVTDGIARMRELTGGVEIAPGATLTFEPGGNHLMFMGLKGALKDGEKISGSLTFEKAGVVPVEFAVEPLKTKAGGAEMDHSKHGGGHDHSSHGAAKHGEASGGHHGH
ncbi:MAG: copper chaperone PCu(A)C [Pseudomonadota bacterium]